MLASLYTYIYIYAAIFASSFLSPQALCRAMVATTATMKEIEDLVKIAQSADSKSDKDGLVSAIESVIDKLIVLGLAYYDHLPPHKVGVHKSNRYGLGVVAHWVQKLGLQITRMGWSWLACQGAVCIEDDDNRGSAKKTVELQSGSPLFGQSKLLEIGYGSLACGHTNQFLVAALSNAECQYEYISIDGRMSKNRIVDLRPNMADVFEKGLKWLILRKQVEVLFPDLPALVQAARQAIGQVQHGESLYELLEAIQAIVSATATNEIDWKSLEARIAKSESKHVADIPVLSAFIRLYGGGKKGQFNRRLQMFVQGCVPDGQYIGSSTFAAIVGLKFRTDEYCPNFMIAILETQSNCPPSAVRSGICRFITESDINALVGAKKQAMINAEKIMKVVWSVAHLIEDRIPKDKFLDIMGRFDVLVVRVVLDKPRPTHIKKVESVAGQALADLSGLAPDFEFENPWKSHIIEQSEEPTVDVMNNVFEYDENGQVESINKIELIAKGFEPGAKVKKDGRIFKIDHIDDDGSIFVRPMNVDGTYEKNLIKTNIESFLAKYTKTSEGRAMLKITASNMYHSNLDIVLNAARSSIFTDAFHLHAKHSPEVTIKSEPEKAVYVNRNYAKGVLKLVFGLPSTSQIKESKGVDVPYGAIHLKGHESKSKLYFVPTMSKDIIVPASWVKVSTTSKSDATVHIDYMKYKDSTIEIPYLTNSIPLKKGDELIRYLAPKKKSESVVDRSLPTSKKQKLG